MKGKFNKLNNKINIHTNIIIFIKIINNAIFKY